MLHRCLVEWTRLFIQKGCSSIYSSIQSISKALLCWRGRSNQRREKSLPSRAYFLGKGKVNQSVKEVHGSRLRRGCARWGDGVWDRKEGEGWGGRRLGQGPARGRSTPGLSRGQCEGTEQVKKRWERDEVSRRRRLGHLGLSGPLEGPSEASSRRRGNVIRGFTAEGCLGAWAF